MWTSIKQAVIELPQSNLPMRLMLKSLVFTLMLMFLWPSTAEAKELVQRVFSAKDGLANGVINDIAFDSKGFVWLGTEQGLYRLSNAKIRRIDKIGSDTKLFDSYITFIENADDDHLLIGTQTRLFLYSITENTFQQLGQTEKNLSLGSHIVIDSMRKSQKTLLLTKQGAVFEFNPADASLSLTSEFELSTKRNWHFMASLNQSQLIFAARTHIELWNSDGELVSILPWDAAFGRIRNLFVDSKQQLWILSTEGLYQFEQSSMSISKVPRMPYYMVRMLEDEHGHFWLASRQGLIFWDPKKDEISLFQDELKQKANIDYIHDLAIDKHGLIWAGGSGDGLAVVSQEADFVKDTYSKTSKYRLKNEMIWSIVSDENKTWLGSDGSISVINHQTDKVVNIIPQGLEVNDSLYRIIELDQEHLLLGGTNGLFVLNKNTDLSMDFSQWSTGQDSLRGKIVFSLDRDKHDKDRIWIATNEGLYYWEPSLKEPKLYPLAEHDEDGLFIVLATLRDSVGRLWISGNKMFGYLDENNQFVSKQSLFSRENRPEISSFMEVAPGIFWFGSLQNGVLEYNSESNSLSSLNERWDLDCSAALAMSQTKQFYLVICDGTLLRVNKLNHQLDIYDHKDGMLYKEYNEGAIYYDEEKGLFLGSPNGVMLMDPQQLKHRIAKPEVFLESVTVYHDANAQIFLNPSKLQQVKPGSSLISFQLTTSDYLDDTPLTFQYRLLEYGKDTDIPFLQFDGQSQINIAGLSAGKYTLELKHRTKGMWEMSPHSFQFEILQHWWRSQLFKWLIVIVSLVIGLSLLWYRQFQLVKFKQINQALLDSDDRLRQALKGSDSDLWEWSSKSQLIYLENQSGVLGDRAFLLCSLTELPIHENDRLRVRGEWNSLLERKGELFESEYRYYRENGSLGWLRVRGRAVEQDPISGEITRVAGIYSDISVQRELESEVNLLAQAFENTTEGMLILDANETVIISNLAANLIFATKPNELIGLSLSELVRKGDNNLSVDTLLGNAISWNGERELLRRDMRTFPAWMNISAMHSENSLIKHYVLVFSDISERKQNELNLRYLANNDVLTGLANRATFTRRLTQMIGAAELEDEKLALLFLDLDRFKHVNDSYGHSMGDALLVEAARRLQSCLSENHLVCRFGGDEFVILLRDAEDIDGINHVAGTLLKMIEKPFRLEGREFFISTSIGISVWPDDSVDPEALIKNADLAMYHAKEEGRGNFQYYSAERNAEALYHLKLEADLRKAIEREEFILNYQPQVDILHQDRVVGVEALIRWEHPTDGFIRPDIFIKVAESCGLIVDIDRLVFKQACKDAARWYHEFEQSYKLSVNVSAISFRQADFIDGLQDILAQTGMPAALLTVEITEGVLMKELHVANVHLRKLKAMGIKVSIDDFGTGYSSLAYLRHFEVDSLKIDRSFLIDIGVNKADQAIVSSIVELARNLKLEVVAEGVESHEQLEQVFSRGCYLIQGYYFAKPMTRNELEIYLRLDS